MCSGHVSVGMNAQRMQRIRLPGHPGETPSDPGPLPRPNGGGQPWPCACAQSPTKLHASCVSTQPLLLHTSGHVNNCVHASTCCNCGITTVFSQTAHEETLDLHPGTSNTLSMDCSLGITMVCKITWTMGNSLCVTKGMSTTCRCTQRACERPCPRTISRCAATVGSRL